MDTTEFTFDLHHSEITIEYSILMGKRSRPQRNENGIDERIFLPIVSGHLEMHDEKNIENAFKLRRATG